LSDELWMEAKMDLQQSTQRLLQEIGSGKMMTTAYDTAWIARLAELGEPMGEEALEWLRKNQLADGSWGAAEPRYHHDRVICTLAAMPALARTGLAKDRIRCQRAQVALETDLKGLLADPAGETVGFEMIAPTLLAEAEALGLLRQQHNGNGAALKRLARQRADKLSALPEGMISRFDTAAFSAEMAGPDGLHLLDVENLQEANGSVGHSPSATAYFALHARRQDQAALEYLREVVIDGHAPNVAPFDVFEQAWTLWNFSLLGSLDDETLALCQPHLDFLQEAWKPGVGAGFAAEYTPKDGDDTSLVYKVLKHFGRPVDLDAMLNYETDDCFRCYSVESNPSISANIHTLGALRQAGLDAEHPAVLKIVQFLFNSQLSQLYWHDKWHASPYYATSHAIIAGVGYVDWLVEDAVYWVLMTQNSDGSWGYYNSTAEETAYCLQALAIWKRNGHSVPDDVLERGAAWLAEHAESPYPPLWIGKCLYCPELVVRSAVLSALMLVEQVLQSEVDVLQNNLDQNDELYQEWIEALVCTPVKTA
jgi:halimadienyl-diphosphate synthase